MFPVCFNYNIILTLFQIYRDIHIKSFKSFAANFWNEEMDNEEDLIDYNQRRSKDKDFIVSMEISWPIFHQAKASWLALICKK